MEAVSPERGEDVRNGRLQKHCWPIQELEGPEPARNGAFLIFRRGARSRKTKGPEPTGFRPALQHVGASGPEAPVERNKRPRGTPETLQPLTFGTARLRNAFPFTTPLLGGFRYVGGIARASS